MTGESDGVARVHAWPDGTRVTPGVAVAASGLARGAKLMVKYPLDAQSNERLIEFVKDCLNPQYLKGPDRYCLYHG